MSSKVSPVTTSADLGLPPKAAPDLGPTPGGREIPAQVQADLRLIIEEDPASGSFVYKTLDRRTGEVVQQFPIEQILRLKQDDRYQAGAIITAKA